MGTETLKNYVLALADADVSLSEPARLAVLAALEDPDVLSEALGGAGTSSQLADSLGAADEPFNEPVGAYLASITVSGFRGIGPKVSVPLQPGPGLTVIAGRNGSGKSTLAEALELALTGVNSRWRDKPVVWSQNWRNLHTGDPAQIRIDIAEEGSGTTTIGVDWSPGDDVPVERMQQWIQRKGQKREPVGILGWDVALTMYRPLLSYDELSTILEGKPSEFYDQLYRLLGLEQLTTAINVLDTAVKKLKEPALQLKKAADTLKTVLVAHEDSRAVTALAQVRKSKPDLSVVRPLITGAPVNIPPSWEQARRLVVPNADHAEPKLAVLRSAARAEQREAQRADTVAADRARLLESGLEFHEQHGDQSCPICGEGLLDAHWAVAARAALEQAETAAWDLTAARAESRQARSAIVAMVRTVDRPPLSDAELTGLDAARLAYNDFAELPVDDDLALADHVETTLPPLRAAYTKLAQEAAALIQAREDSWSPVALKLADWLQNAEAAAVVAPQWTIATEALKWLQGNASQLRNERLAPLTKKSRQIWSALRQESNVDLGAIRLEGQRTTRRVVLRAAVDGSETEAFGVMSQGELQALALAIFIPRATSPESPFRFLVFDDPIQAMDPSKIDGFLDVLTGLAEDRQVIVLTHDNRLPAAIRSSRAPARILEVTRAMNSAISVVDSTKPATRLLDDAFAIAADDAVPEDVKRSAIPALCREALEATAWDVFSAKSFRDGLSREDVETAWESATKTARRLALALAGSADDQVAVDKWKSGGKARRDTLTVVNKGIHQGVSDYKGAVNDARLAVGDLAKGVA
ncbi:recombinase RecF [Mycobacterium paragordonae]|uniref:ATP-binding protein n=1 Tax=Mycobacterium paragordonae TaxID=1389713 RepID=UPI0010611028|nr:ATP-binding protein [Mycobacterium paragordonae]TDK99185.1 recombinase RecF [Mycobacterium paragordonae]